MACTRKKNTMCDYALEQRRNIQSEQYNLYVHGANGNPLDIYLPGNGFGNVSIRGREQANNQVDIESFLRGTGTVDLAQGIYAQLTPDLICIPTLNLFQNENVIEPVPFISQPNRPWPI